MILLNRKADYALLILCFLHHRSEGGCARVIAAHFGISKAFVANILKDLCRKGFVVSQRGVKGGYVLQSRAEQTTLADLLDALDDEKLRLAECNSDQPESCCSLLTDCPIRAPIAEVHRRIRQVLETVTLADVFAQPRNANCSVHLGLDRCNSDDTTTQEVL